MKLRCFYGPLHGMWREHKADMPYRKIHIRCGALQRDVLVHETKAASDVMDWLFTYDEDHPQHTDDPNHPRVTARAAG